MGIFDSLTRSDADADQPAPAGDSGSSLPSSTSSPSHDGRASLERRRDELVAQVAELHWDLGGLAYEMAIRDHFRLDVLVRRAAETAGARRRARRARTRALPPGVRGYRLVPGLRGGPRARGALLLAVRPDADGAHPERRHERLGEQAGGR